MPLEPQSLHRCLCCPDHDEKSHSRSHQEHELTKPDRMPLEPQSLHLCLSCPDEKSHSRSHQNMNSPSLIGCLWSHSLCIFAFVVLMRRAIAEAIKNMNSPSLIGWLWSHSLCLAAFVVLMRRAIAESHQEHHELTKPHGMPREPQSWHLCLRCPDEKSRSRKPSRTS